MGIVVLLDVVHSHISSNADDGLAGVSAVPLMSKGLNQLAAAPHQQRCK
jgi:1,4-alpha-glucan branching enzyme